MNSANYLRDTIDLTRQIETRFLELAARLYQIKTAELWESTYSSYQEFLDTAKISKSNASMLTSIHKAYVVDGGVGIEELSKAGYSNLYEAIPLIASEGVEGTVLKARLLTRSEIKDEVREDKYGECTEHTPITICSTCHHRL